MLFFPPFSTGISVIFRAGLALLDLLSGLWCFGLSSCDLSQRGHHLRITEKECSVCDYICEKFDFQVLSGRVYKTQPLPQPLVVLKTLLYVRKATNCSNKNRECLLFWTETSTVLVNCKMDLKD